MDIEGWGRGNPVKVNIFVGIWQLVYKDVSFFIFWVINCLVVFAEGVLEDSLGFSLSELGSGVW